jgi:recombination protein RecR
LLDAGKDKCLICLNIERKHDIICIVEEYLDMLSIEQTGYYNGTYHILG